MFLIVPVIRGRWQDKQDKTAWYARLFGDEVERAEAAEKAGDKNGESQAIGQASGMDIGEIASRRLLQMQPGNSRARYYVAQGMARRGQVAHARVIFNELAPESEKGYAPAHAWVVQDLINRAQELQQPPPRDLLKHHVQVATTADDATPELFALHSAILESEVKRDEAIAKMNLAAQKDGKYWLELASLCRRSGKEDQVELSARNSIRYSIGLLENTTGATTFQQLEQIRAQIAAGYSFMGDFDKAIEVLKQGLRTEEKCEILRQSLSNVYLLRYQRDLQRSNDPSRFALTDLEEAMRWNPVNTAVADMISKLMVFQAERRQQLHEMLEKQIALGGASAISHILLANEAILDSKIDDALPHLEVAYKHNPKALNILNNLSLALAISSKPDIKRAESLIDEAIQLAGESPEILDTKGQILAIAGKDIDAIRCYERAIDLTPSRVKTRERLVALYEKVGMKELIPPQLAAIEGIKREMRLAIQRRDEQLKREARAKLEMRKKVLAAYCQPPELNSGGPPVPPGVK
jgi:tetratricopeptide (TPR) repeat protein